MNIMTISPQRIEELKNMPDSAIDTSDIPELDRDFWDKAKLVHPRTKQAISIIKARDISL
jgi:uncharacterized protein (UPF0305 family)